MSIQIDCTVDLEPTPLNVTLLPSSEIAVSWPPPGTVNTRIIPSPSIDVSYLPASPIEVTLLPSSSFDVALLPPTHIDIIRSTDVMGPPGPPGPQGPTGPTGPQGQGIVIKGTVATHTSLPTSGNTVGDMWITADTGHGWVWQANSTWLDAGPIQGPPGPPGASAASKTVCGETPVGAINGTNLNYASANPYSPGLLSVYLNGLRLRRSADYTETGSQSFQFLNAPLPGDSLSIDYIQSSGTGTPYSFPVFVPDSGTAASTAYTLGVVFTVSVACQLTQIIYYKSGSETVNSRQVGLWNSAGTLLGSQAVTDTGLGWNTVTLTTPIALSPGITYYAGYNVVANGGYSSSTTFPVISGPLNASVGCYGGGVFAFPNTTYPYWFGVNLTVIV